MKPHPILIFTLLSFTLGLSALSALSVLSSAQEVTVAASHTPASTVLSSQGSQETTSSNSQTPNSQASSAPKLAQPKPTSKKVTAPLPASSASDLSVPLFAAQSYMLYDLSSHQTLLSNNATDRIDPAALTKLMVAYVSFSSLRSNKITLKQSVQPAAETLRGENSGPDTSSGRMFLSRNKAVTVDELLHGLIILSANDAARVLAVAIAGSETQFSALMNIEAQRLNMQDTHFANATGVNATGLALTQQYSTAADLTLLAAALVRDFPDMIEMYSLREYQHNGIKQTNRNRLLWMDPFVDGLAIGNIGSTEFSIVASAKRAQRRLIAVVINAPSNNQRHAETQKILNYGFQHFETLLLYHKDQAVSRIRVWKGTESNIDVGFREDLFITIPNGQFSKLKATMETTQLLFAPIARNQKISTLQLTLDDQPLGEYPLVALERVPVANVLSRGWDNIQLFFSIGRH
mgnify:CR=1 FL=1